MTEVVEKEEVSVEAQKEDKVEAPKLSVHEEKAIGKGWKPKDQFEGDKDEWRPAKEWLERGEFLDTIHELKRDKKETKEALAQLIEHNRKIEEQAYVRALDEIKAKQAQAAEAGDVRAVVEYSNKLLEIGSKPVPAHIAPVTNQIDPAAAEFVQRNQHWFNDFTPENSAMKAFALTLDTNLTRTNPDKSVAEIVAMVEKKVKEKFFSESKPVHKETSPVSAPEAKESSTKDIGYKHLSKDQREMADLLKRTAPKTFKMEKYIQQLKDLGELNV